MGLPVYVLRPYSRRLRIPIETVLEHAGLEISGEVEQGTPDEEVIAWLRSRDAPRALLVPFHAHKDRRGELVHGVELIRRLRTALPSYREVPVLSPISNLGLAAAGLLLTRENAMSLARVLFLYEDELDDTRLSAQVQVFLDHPTLESPI